MISRARENLPSKLIAAHNKFDRSLNHSTFDNASSAANVSREKREKHDNKYSAELFVERPKMQDLNASLQSASLNRWKTQRLPSSYATPTHQASSLPSCEISRS